MIAWTNSQQEEAFETCIDMLTGIFANEKASRIRISAYKYALDGLRPNLILAALDIYIKEGQKMPTPRDIRHAVKNVTLENPLEQL